MKFAFIGFNYKKMRLSCDVTYKKFYYKSASVALAIFEIKVK